MSINPFSPPKLNTKSTNKWLGYNETTINLALINLINISPHERVFVYITTNNQSANNIRKELILFNKDLISKIFILADWETLPYEQTPVHSDIISKRLNCLHKLTANKCKVLILPLTAAFIKTPPKSFINHQILKLKLNQLIDIDEFSSMLTNQDYTRVQEVHNRGEYTIKGSIVDVFPIAAKKPYRIDFYDNRVDSIRSFDPDTQTTITKVDNIHIFPTHEYNISNLSEASFMENWKKSCTAAYDKKAFSGILAKSLNILQNHLALLHSNLTDIFAYVPNNSLIIMPPDLDVLINEHWEFIEKSYKNPANTANLPTLAPEQVFISPAILNAKLNLHPRLYLDYDNNPDTIKIPDLQIKYRDSDPINNLKASLKTGLRILVCIDTNERAINFSTLLHTHGVKTKQIKNFNEFLHSNEGISLIIGHLSNPIYDNQQHLLICNESIFAKHIAEETHGRKGATKTTSDNILDLTNLEINDHVVHIEHGIGQYKGMQLVTNHNIETEYILLTYANDDKLYLPMHQIHLINKYVGNKSASIKKDKLGSSQWKSRCKKIQNQANDVAVELLDLYAKRELLSGHKFNINQKEYSIFCSAFPFNETPDQLTAIENIQHDMSINKPMDRLICGDVGFGKTEIAMRATFIAASNFKQVVIVVPTTILANQHKNTFSERFAAWAFRIQILTRQQSDKASKSILQDIEHGKIDVLITTHRLLYSQVKFKQLGLLVIDEEHRFGVSQKDKIKSWHPQVDILSLSATPIPRSLHMAMNALRDISIIASPPVKRLPIKTLVSEKTNDFIYEAILRESKRGGQIYFLHNEIRTINKIKDQLCQLIPSLSIKIAHGQMSEIQLEMIMTQFYQHEFQLLLCTTIIESGIDIPNANTIIINRADKLGLAQLHQLRGRVGRSHHQAYAYLFIPPKQQISKSALLRIESMQEYKSLGAGFQLAINDLEIRGAGDLLGDKQSGDVASVGLHLYTEMIKQASSSIKSGEIPNIDLTESHIDIKFSKEIEAFIPRNYILDIYTRLIFYKRISSAANMQNLDDIRLELIDRFGLYTNPMKNLFLIAEIRLISANKSIKQININSEHALVTFASNTAKIKHEPLFKLIQQYPQYFSLTSEYSIKFNLINQNQPPLILFLDKLRQFINTCT